LIGDEVRPPQIENMDISMEVERGSSLHGNIVQEKKGSRFCDLILLQLQRKFLGYWYSCQSCCALEKIYNFHINSYALVLK